MEEGRLSKRNWQAIQRRVPVSTVDVLLIRKGTSGNSEVGLIWRDTPHQGHRWCLIGGRLLLNEPFRKAIVREIRGALGKGIRCTLHVPVQPIFVAEYFSQQRKGSLFDPRQHAVGLTFSAEIQGHVQTRGEALDFRWFDVDRLPGTASIGFGQKKLIVECIRRIDFAGLRKQSA